MQSIMVMDIKGDSVEIFKKIWHWLSQDVTKGFQKSDEELMLKNTTYNTGGFIKNAERYVAPRYYSEATSNNTARRDSDDNFLMGAVVGYVIADSLNDSPSARDIELPKSSNYESSYTPSSSSSYNSGSYSSSFDSDSSSSSCDSGY